MSRIVHITACIAALLLGFVSPASPEGEPLMMEVRYVGHHSYPGFTRLAFEAKGAVTSGFRINHDEAGGRIVFYPVDGLLALTFAPVPPVDGMVRGVDFVEDGYAKRGIVIKLGAEASGVKVSRLTDPDTLVLDIYHKAGPKPAMPYDRPVRTIAIDPGHGGGPVNPADPSGKAGIAEGDLMLDLALRLGKSLSAAGYRVVLTRENDTAVPPDRRAGFANNARADLFVSLHAGGSFGADGEPPAVYTCGAGELGMKSAPLAWQGQSAAYLPASLDLAASVSRALAGTLGGKPPVRQARLAGMSGLAMPAVLVELGRFSGAGEGGALAEDAIRDKVAQQIAIGVNSYARGEAEGQ